jgi:teichuronic acid biosynthesis glycosyltransferase TuaH
MVRELSRDFPVTFIESLGLRRPELNLRDIRRAANRLRRPARNPSLQRPVPDGVTIVSPKIVPIHRAPWLRPNRILLERAIGKWMHSTDVRVHWSYSPVTYDFNLAADISVYHCVDLYAEFPGIDRELISRSERRLARAGSLAIGSSEVVVEHLKRQGFEEVLYWPNVADVERIKASKPEGPSSARSGALFAGNLSDKKVDFELLRSLLDLGIELHLAGPIAEGGGDSQALVDTLIASGAVYHGVLDLDGLSDLMHSCLVGLIPYHLNSYTQGVSPLKTYEYLAAGLAVVSTPVPAVAPVEYDVVVSDSVSGFRDATKQSMRSATDEDHQRRLSLAEAHSWQERGQAARSLIRELCEPVRDLRTTN